MQVRQARRGESRPTQSRQTAFGNIQPAIDDAECFAELLLGDDERWVREEVIPPYECEESLLTEELAERCHLGRGAVERRHRLPGLAVANQFNDAKQPDGACRAH
jgi:hypothetical protein